MPGELEGNQKAKVAGEVVQGVKGRIREVQGSQNKQGLLTIARTKFSFE